MEKDDDVCLACGESTVKGARVAASTLPVFLKAYLSKRCQESGVDVDIDAVINASFACRSCHNKFLTHQQKDTTIIILFLS
jgi:hypothetical protein